MTSLLRARLSLRQKIVAILALYVLGIGAMGIISYEDLRTMEDKLEFMRLGHVIANTILEVRRYEKNYLLYGLPEDLAEDRRYLGESFKTLDALTAEARDLKVSSQLGALRNLLRDYRQALAALAASGGGQGGEAARKLREIGKELTEAADAVVEFELSRIHALIRLLGAQLLLAVSVSVALGVALPLLMFRKIFQPLGIIRAATQDIAAGRFKEIQVVNTNDEIEQVMEAINRMVAEIERRQDQLVQTKKLSSIGTLTAGVAHQLNNPLNNISTSSQIALDELETADPAFLRKLLGNILQETLRARDIVQGLLEFSRAREFSLRPVVLSELAGRTLRLVSSQGGSGVRLTSDVPDDLVIPADASRLQEALLNLLINGIQAVDGSGEVRLAARCDAAAGQAVITVSDTGPGIPKEIKSRVFDPFYTTKEEGKGTGLGLSIVYGIVEKHAGTITVDSDPGQGAVFTIRLPLSEGASGKTDGPA
ncbi:sensor histidine kinase [Solidesulfovibrio sp. C21]|uniref:sensor histidine kinase n=1 Tax=Solidesulfovibrio sp. C21 TaxID=3398613 RepID=UPI0039FC56BE